MNKYGDLQQLAADKTRFYVITMMFRPGALAFSERLESTLYPPGTPRNELFQLILVKWPDGEPLDWCVLSFPIADRGTAEKIANECGLRFADGVPTILSGPKLLPTFFPMKGENVWSLQALGDRNINPDERARRSGQGWG